MQRSLIIALFLILITVVFALQNSDPVMLKLFFWTVNLPAAFIIPAAVLLGALLGILFSVPTIQKRNEKIRKLKEDKTGSEMISDGE